MACFQDIKQSHPRICLSLVDFVFGFSFFSVLDISILRLDDLLPHLVPECYTSKSVTNVKLQL